MIIPGVVLSQKHYFSFENKEKAKKPLFIILILLCSNFTNGQELVDSTITVKKEEKTSYYVEAESYGTKRASDPPSYVRKFNTIFNQFKKNDWIEIGLDHRSRFEIRENDLRRNTLTTDYPLLLRHRAYFGITKKLDPFRFAVELEDANRVFGNFEKDNRDINRAELIQLYSELYFKNILPKDDLGNNRPIMIRFGRQAFEFLDRRLIGSNDWRNTTNNFLGLRTTIGQDKNDWQIDLLALKPINRIIDSFDETNKNINFYAVIGHWRKWSNIITIEPYYLGLEQKKSISTKQRLIHSPGIRFYGWIHKKSINYDVSYTQQFGKDNNQTQQAYGITSEIGYIFQHTKMKPRISLFYGNISGDKNPYDNINNRFERFYGFARPWSADDYIIPENIITKKIRVELTISKKIKIDAGYSFYKLNSSTDRFNNLLNGNNNRDITGTSGTSLGHNGDIRLQIKVNKFIDTNIGYSHHTMGDFVKNRQEDILGYSKKNSNFTYIQLSINFLDIFK